MAKSVWLMSFGKYKGQPIEDIPDSYLNFLLEQEWFCTKFQDKVKILQDELSYREKFDKQIGN